MKRFFSLMVSLLLLLTPVLAMGEAAEYTDGNFTFSCPAGWSVMTLEAIDELVATAEKDGNEMYKLVLEGTRAQMEELGMIIVTSDDMISSINIIPQDAGAEVTNEVLAAMKDGVIEELTSMMDVSFPEEPAMLDLADGRQALLVQYSMPLFDDYALLGSRAYAGVGNTLFVIEVTSEPDRAEADAEALSLVLSSLRAN